MTIPDSFAKRARTIVDDALHTHDRAQPSPRAYYVCLNEAKLTDERYVPDGRYVIDSEMVAGRMRITVLDTTTEVDKTVFILENTGDGLTFVFPPNRRHTVYTRSLITAIKDIAVVRGGGQ